MQIEQELVYSVVLR